MRKMWKRSVSGILSAAMLVTSVPAQPIFATESDVIQNSDYITGDEQHAVDKTLPAGVAILPSQMPVDVDSLSPDEEDKNVSFFVMGTGQETVQERGKYAITVYRFGNTDKESSVVVKTIDYSALYGKDYVVTDERFETETFSSEETLLQQSAKQENMEDAAEIMEEFLGSDAVTDTGAAVGAYIYDASSEEEVSESTPVNDDVEALSSLPESEMSLAQLKQLETGKATRETMEDLESEDLMGLADLVASDNDFNSADYLDGSSITNVVFSPGETEKQLVFEILEDKESEGDELIQFALVAPETEDQVIEPNMSTVMISDDEPAERSQIAFSAAEYEADADTAKIKLVREGATYNMVTLTVSIRNLNKDNDYTTREIAFSPYQMENEIELRFNLGDEPMDYALELKDIKGGDEGSITKAVLHVGALQNEFKDSDIVADGIESLGAVDGDSSEIEALGHEAAEDGGSFKIGDHYFDLESTGTNGVYKIMSRADDLILNRKHPVQVGEYYAAESDYFRVKNMWYFGDSPSGSYSGWNKSGKYMTLDWYSKIPWDEGGAAIKFDIPEMTKFAGLLLDYTALSNWDSCKTVFSLQCDYSSGRYSVNKSLRVKKRQNGPDDSTDNEMEDREFMGPIRMTEGSYSYKTGNPKDATKIQDAGKIPWVGYLDGHFVVYTEKDALGALNPTVHLYGLAAMYKSVKFTLEDPSKMEYLKADGTKVSEVPARVNVPDDHPRFYGESITFDVEQKDDDIHVPKGKIKGWEIIPTEGQKFTVLKEDAVNGKINYLSKDGLTITVNNQFLDELSKHGIAVKNGDLTAEGYRMNVSVKPIFDYIPVHVKVLPSEGKGKFTSSALSEVKEYTFHVGDTLDLRGTPEEGWYYKGYSMTTYKNYDDTQAKMDAPVVLHPINLKLSNEEYYVIRPVFTQKDNNIRIIMDDEAKKYFEIQGLCKPDELPDSMKDKNILKIDNRQKETDPVYLPMAGDAYEIRLLNTAANSNGTYRPVFKIRDTGQIVNGYVMDFIAGVTPERNVIEVSASANLLSYQYYEINSKAVYSSAKLRNADGEKTTDPACGVQVKVGGVSKEGYNKDKQKVQMLYRTSTVTGDDGSFTLSGFEAVPGDIVSVCFDNDDRQQVKYVKLPGGMFSFGSSEWISPSKRTFDVLEPDDNEKGMKTVTKTDVDTYVVNMEPMGMPIISPRSPEVTKLTYEYDEDAMRDTFYNMVELRPNETISVSVEVLEKETGVRGVKFILYDKNGNEKESTEGGGGSQTVYNGENGKYTAKFTADNGLKAGDTLYVQIESSEYKTVKLTDGSTDKKYRTYPRINSGLSFGDVIMQAKPQTFTVKPAEGDYMKKIPFIGETGSGLMADSGAITFNKTFMDNKHKETSGYYLTVGLNTRLSGEDFKKKREKLDEWRNGKHEDAKAAQDAKFDIAEKVAQMDPMTEANANEKKALNDSLAASNLSGAEKQKIEEDWKKGVKEKYRKEITKQHKKDSAVKMNEKEKETPHWGAKAIVLFVLEYVYDKDNNDYRFAGGQYMFGGSFSYKRVWQGVLVCVPVYFAMQHEVSITFDGTWKTNAGEQYYSQLEQTEHLEDYLQTKWPWMNIGYVGKFMPGVGIYGVIGARGEIEFAINTRFAVGVQKGASGGLLLSIGGGIAIDIIGMNLKHKIGKATFRSGVYDSSKVKNLGAGEDESEEGIEESYGLEAYDLSGDEVSFLGQEQIQSEEFENLGLGIQAPANIEDQMILVKNAAEYVRPHVVAGAQNERFMTYLKKKDGKARIAYSVDKGDGKGFSAEEYVDAGETDGMDLTSDLLYYDGKVYIAWTHADEVVEKTENEGEDISITDAKDSMQSMNLKLAIYDYATGEMSEPVQVTDDRFLNDNVRLYAEAGKVVLYFFKKDITNVETAEQLVSERSNYSSWAMAEYDIGTGRLVNYGTEEAPKSWQFVVIDHPTITDPLVLDYSSAIYKTPKDREWRLSLYTVDRTLNSDANDTTVDTDAIDAEIWLVVKDVAKDGSKQTIKLAEGNVTNARLNIINDGILVTWLKDARSLYTVSADDLFYEDENGISNYEHYLNHDKRVITAEDENGKIQTVATDEEYKINYTMTEFAEGEDDIVNLFQYQVVSGSDGNDYLFALAPGNEGGLENGQELWGASYYRGKAGEDGSLIDKTERTGWGELTQITHYGRIIDEISLDVTQNHQTTILANIYENTIDEEGLTSHDFNLVELDCDPVSSLSFVDDPEISTDSGYPMPGEKATIAFTVENIGLLPAKNYRIDLYQGAGDTKTPIDDHILWNAEEDTIFTGEERDFSFEVTIPESLNGLSYTVAVTELEAGNSSIEYGTQEAVCEVPDKWNLEEFDKGTVSGLDLLSVYDIVKDKAAVYGAEELTLDQMSEIELSLNDTQIYNLLILYSMTKAKDLNELINTRPELLGVDEGSWYAVAYLYNSGNEPAVNVVATATKINDDSTRGKKLGDSVVVSSIDAKDFGIVVVPVDIHDGEEFNDIGVLNLAYDVSVNNEPWSDDISFMIYTVDNVGISRSDGKDSLVMAVGKSQTLGLTAHPFEKRGQLIYVSDNPEVVAVDELGIVTAVGVGSCSIYAFDLSCDDQIPHKKIDIETRAEVQNLEDNKLTLESVMEGDTLYLLKGGKYTFEDGLSIVPGVSKAVTTNDNTHVLTVKNSSELTLKMGDDTRTVNLKAMTVKKKNVSLNSRKQSFTLAEMFPGLEDMMPDISNGQYSIEVVKDPKKILKWDGPISAQTFLTLDDIVIDSTGAKGSATIKAVFGGKAFTATVKCTGYPVIDNPSGSLVQHLIDKDSAGNLVLTYDSVEDGDVLLLLKNGKYALESGVTLTPVGSGYKNAIKVTENKKTGIRKLKLSKEAAVKLSKEEEINGEKIVLEKTIIVNFVTIKKKTVKLAKAGDEISLEDIFTGACELLPDTTGEEAYGGYAVSVTDTKGVLDIGGEDSFPGVPDDNLLTLKDFKISHAGKSGNANISVTFGGRVFKGTVKCK